MFQARGRLEVLILWTMLMVLTGMACGRKQVADADDHFGRPVGVGLVSMDELSMQKFVMKAVMPEYPRHSVRQHSEGVAVAAVRVDLDGSVQKVKVLQAPDDHTRAAVRVAVRSWIFKPMDRRTKGQTVSVLVDTKLTFYFRITADGRATVARPEPQTPPADTPTITEISASELLSAGNSQMAIIDIRVREVFAAEHRESARNIPADEVSARAGELLGADTVVIDCTFPEIETEVCRTVARILSRRLSASIAILVPPTVPQGKRNPSLTR